MDERHVHDERFDNTDQGRHEGETASHRATTAGEGRDFVDAVWFRCSSSQGKPDRELHGRDSIRRGFLPPDFLSHVESVGALCESAELTDEAFEDYEARLRGVFEKIPSQWSPNESVTEDELIWPVLGELAGPRYCAR